MVYGVLSRVKKLFGNLKMRSTSIDSYAEVQLSHHRNEKGIELRDFMFITITVKASDYYEFSPLFDVSTQSFIISIA